MARKRKFTNKHGREILLGGKKRELSFPDLERQKRAGSGRGARLKKALPASWSRQLERVRGIHLAVGLVLVSVISLLFWFFFFVYPSPVGGLNPGPDSSINTSAVEVKATFSRAVKPKEVSIKVDGKDVTADASVKSKSVSAKLGLTDGEHKAEVVLSGGGLMGKRTAQWSFTVDTSPPKLTITNKKVTQEKESDQVDVSFSGKTDKDATVKVQGSDVPVDSNGSFKGKAITNRLDSLKITATDRAGNEANAFIVTQKPPTARGVHVSFYIAASDSDLDKMIGLVERTELNALQIDLKDEYGKIGFDTDNKLAREIGSANDYIELDACVDRIRCKDIYTICRVVTFKDPVLAGARPDLGVKDKYGGPWGKGQWADPYLKEVWDYNIAVAVAAAKAGFNEIQFDYVRFPSDGNTDTCLYPGKDDRSPVEVIDGFLAYAREQLAPYNVFISADLFGLTASDQGDMGIGQSVKAIAERVDYLSPMVYPSHYNPGEYDIKSPEHNPGDTVAASMEDFKKAIKGTSAGLRPWLQDFSLKVPYPPDMVRRQIDAVENAGIDQWLLWDPDCTYSEPALEPASK
ncbi:MAG: hypothetical protein KKE56_02245 [Actinobacteria bacterium]|nr:hypothetical protein [Actinomycetota bacterium]